MAAVRVASTHAEPIVRSQTNMAATTSWVYMRIMKLSGLERIYEHLYVPTGRGDQCAGVDWLYWGGPGGGPTLVHTLDCMTYLFLPLLAVFWVVLSGAECG